MNDIFASLPVQWSHTDSEGLVRVITTGGFRRGLAVVALIGRVAEQLEYFPELRLSHDEVVVMIDDHDPQQALELARQIDSTLDETLAD